MPGKVQLTDTRFTGTLGSAYSEKKGFKDFERKSLDVSECSLYYSVSKPFNSGIIFCEQKLLLVTE